MNFGADLAISLCQFAITRHAARTAFSRDGVKEHRIK
jgi:hypothetical protein